MKNIILPFLIAGSLFSTSQADVLANWDLDPLAGTETSAAVTTEDALITTTALTRKVGSTTASYQDSLGVIHNNAAVNSLATAITANDFFTFSITPDAGQQVSYDSIFTRVTLQANTQPAATTFNLLSSVTGFTSSDSLGSFESLATVSGANNSSGTFSSLSGVTELQNVAGPVEFRIYYYNTGANSTTRLVIGQGFATNGTPDLTVNGSISAIPEPSSLALLGLAALVSMTVLRRRR